MRKGMVFLMVLAVLLSCFAGCDTGKPIQSVPESSPIKTEPTEAAESALPAVTQAYTEAAKEAVILLADCPRGYVGGVLTELPDLLPEQIDGELYVPGGLVAVGLGGTAQWEEDTLWLSLGDQKVAVTGAETGLLLNGQSTQGVAVDSEVLLPVRALSDYLGVEAVCEEGLAFISPEAERCLEGMDPDAAAVLRNMTANTLLHSPVIGSAAEVPAATQSTAGYRLFLVEPELIPFTSPKEGLVAHSGPLYVEDLAVSPSDKKPGEYDISLTIYNYLGYTYGSIEAYNEDGQLLKSSRIDPYEGMKSSVLKTFSDVATLTKDGFRAIQNKDWDYLSYKTSLNATSANFTASIPPGGYVVLTTNMSHSDYVTVYNFMHILTQIALASDPLKNACGSDQYAELAKQITEANMEQVINGTFPLAELALDIRNIFGALEANPTDMQGYIGEVFKKALVLIDQFEIDFSGIVRSQLEKQLGIAETAVLLETAELVPGVGTALKGWELSANISNLICLLGDFWESNHTDTIVIQVRDWRAVYRQYLLDNQESVGHARSYSKGNGRFGLPFVSGNSFPDLLITDEMGQTMLYTCKNGAAEKIQFAAGWTDIFRFSLDQFYWNGQGEILIGSANEKRENWELYSRSPDPMYGFVLNCSAKAYPNMGNYIFNVYSPGKMLADGMEYRLAYTDRAVTELLYRRFLRSYGISGFEGTCGTDIPLWKIVPEDIEDRLG